MTPADAPYDYAAEIDDARRAAEFRPHPDHCTCRACALDNADEPHRRAA